MRVLEVTEYGAPDVLRLAERPDPWPVEGKVRVRMAATAVNPADLAIRSGVLAARLPSLAFPFTLGFDIAGVVLDDGHGFHAGQRVAGLYPWLMLGIGGGTNGEIVVADPSWLVPLPDNVDWATAATVPLNALTASQALDLTGVRTGETVLVTGASGAVGAFAVQFAAVYGADVVAVASAGDEDYVGGLGAKYVLTRAEPDELARRVRQLTGGVDGVFDAALIGAPALAAVRDGGTFVSANQARMPGAERGITVDAVLNRPDAAALGGIVDRIAGGELSTRVADVLPIEDGAEAHERVAGRGFRGRIVLEY